jgi:hypothetical protein
MAKRVVVAAAAIVTMLVPACGGGGRGGGGAGADNPTSVTVAAGDERAAHPLAPGRYRLTITETCDSWSITITEDGGSGFTWTKANAATQVHFVNDLPGGSFFIEQTDAACTEWEVSLVRVSGGG